MKKEEFYREAMANSRGPLEGIRVLEASTSGAGPWAGTLLTDMGADTLKIDQPKVGDISRHIPPFVDSEDPINTSCFYLSINRGKKNLTLELKEPEGQEIFRELARRSDIVIENYKPGTMDRWGIGYEDVRKVKPDIIYTSVSGFGQYGPWSDRPSYNPVGEAWGGIMHVTGHPDGPPTQSGNAMCDNISGWLAAYATLAALFHRQRTGEGQHVDVSQVDTMLYTSGLGIISAANTDFQWSRRGNRSDLVSPANTYLCRDGYVYICVLRDAHWIKFCRAIEREDLSQDPRLQTVGNRAAQGQLIDQAVEAWTAERSVDEVVALLSDAGIVVTAIPDFHQIIRTEHILERDMVVEVEHPAAGPVKLYGVGPKLSRTPGRVQGPAPLLGEHTDEVLRGWLGFGDDKIRSLRGKGIV